MFVYTPQPDSVPKNLTVIPCQVEQNANTAVWLFACVLAENPEVHPVLVERLRR